MICIIMFLFYCLKKEKKKEMHLCCLRANVNEYRIMLSSKSHSQTNQTSGCSGDYSAERSKRFRRGAWQHRRASPGAGSTGCPWAWRVGDSTRAGTGTGVRKISPVHPWYFPNKHLCCLDLCAPVCSAKRWPRVRVWSRGRLWVAEELGNLPVVG